ncbi:hypothetical protein NQZ68_026047 [Dissostichus eleginoides]|nr:hypothetical protein NQZ68_026047 [Dissostichus eleginoides]
MSKDAADLPAQKGKHKRVGSGCLVSIQNTKGEVNREKLNPGRRLLTEIIPCFSVFNPLPNESPATEGKGVFRVCGRKPAPSNLKVK